MPTARSSTEAPRVLQEARRAVEDVGHLLRLRAGTVRRRRLLGGAGALVLLTLAAAVVPAYLPGAGGSDAAFNVLLLLPTGFAAFLLLALASAVASGGGRELVPRDQLLAYPVSPATDHLGALLLAPLTIAWLLQAWALVGSAAYAAGSRSPTWLVAGTLLWVLAATAVGQLVAWWVETVRRLPHGIGAVRALAAGAVVLVGGLQVAGRLDDVLDALPTRWLVVALLDGPGWRAAAALALIAALGLAAVVLGAVPAGLAARLPPREEADAESGRHRARPTARSDHGALLRLDRASVWRAVPMRRGLVVLAVGPGLVALAGDLAWSQLLVLPGLVASGGALLFGVNAWSLESRGVLWRESLPVAPGTVFVVRARVLAEFLLAASALTLGLAVLRAGRPTVAELVALLCTWAVVLLQVVSASLRWSLRAPYAVDLRSARSTPAPPLAMVGYSTRLALATTVTSLLFSGLSHVEAWPLSVLLAAPLAGVSLLRLLRARDAWREPARRARVVTTVAG